MILWAHIDADGNVLSHGVSQWQDVFLQPLSDGAICVSRPESVTCYSNHKYDFVSQQFIEKD